MTKRGLALLPVVLLAVLAGAAGCKEDKKLKVTRIEPSRGDYNGGQLIEVSGNRFQADGVRSVKVYFGSVPGTVLRFEGDKKLKIYAPPGKVNETVDVKFYFEPGGVLTVPKAYTFIEPNSASVDDLDTSKKK